MFQLHRLRFVFAMFCIGLSACASPQNPPLPQGEGQGVRETPSLVLTETFTLSPAPTETLAPTATPEATATPEVGKFTPANDIEFVEGLPNYDLKLTPDADEKAIYLDAIHNQVAWATSKSKGFESNRAIYEATIKDYPEWEGIGLGSDYNTVVAFMTEFLTRSGGKMIIADASFNKYTADFNLPVKFEVIQVDELPTGYSMYLGRITSSSAGAGGLIYTNEKGQLVYSIAVAPEGIESTQVEKNYGGKSIYFSWKWTPGEVISDLFRQLISENTYKDRYSDKLEYKIYIKGANPKSQGYFRDFTWTFIK